MTTVQLLIDGVWVDIAAGVPALSRFRRAGDAEELLNNIFHFGYLDVDHPKHGRMRICPQSFPARLAK